MIFFFVLTQRTRKSPNVKGMNEEINHVFTTFLYRVKKFRDRKNCHTYTGQYSRQELINKN
jgi:hypothetical protein